LPAAPLKGRGVFLAWNLLLSTRLTDFDNQWTQMRGQLLTALTSSCNGAYYQLAFVD
jgi:hypothetical protein